MTFWNFSKADKVWKMVDFLFRKSKFFSFLEFKKNNSFTREVPLIHAESPLNSVSGGIGHYSSEVEEPYSLCAGRYQTRKFTFLVFLRKPSNWSPESLKTAEKWIPHIRLLYWSLFGFKNGLWKNLFFSALVPPYKIFENYFFSDWAETYPDY